MCVSHVKAAGVSLLLILCERVYLLIKAGADGASLRWLSPKTQK